MRGRMETEILNTAFMHRQARIVVLGYIQYVYCRGGGGGFRGYLLKGQNFLIVVY